MNLANSVKLLHLGWEARSQKEWQPLCVGENEWASRIATSQAGQGEFAGSRAAKPAGEAVPKRLARGPLWLRWPHVPSASKPGCFSPGSATVKALMRPGFSPPHKITCEGAQ